MKAVCTTLGCWAAAAAPIPGPLLLLVPLVLFALVGPGLEVLELACWRLVEPVFSGSDWFPPLRSRAGLECEVRAVGVVLEGVTSIGSPAGAGGVNDEAADDDGSIGMVLCIPDASASAAKGLRRTESALEAMVTRFQMAPGFVMRRWGQQTTYKSLFHATAPSVSSAQPALSKNNDVRLAGTAHGIEGGRRAANGRACLSRQLGRFEGRGRRFFRRAGSSWAQGIRVNGICGDVELQARWCWGWPSGGGQRESRERAAQDARS